VNSGARTSTRADGLREGRWNQREEPEQVVACQLNFQDSMVINILKITFAGRANFAVNVIEPRMKIAECFQMP